MTDWPYVFTRRRGRCRRGGVSLRPANSSSTTWRIRGVAPADMAAACAAAGHPVRIEIDAALPKAARGPVDAPAARDFPGFDPQVGHREGIRRMIEAAG